MKMRGPSTGPWGTWQKSRRDLEQRSRGGFNSERQIGLEPNRLVGLEHCQKRQIKIVDEEGGCDQLIVLNAALSRRQRQDSCYSC